MITGQLMGGSTVRLEKLMIDDFCIVFCSLVSSIMIFLIPADLPLISCPGMKGPTRILVFIFRRDLHYMTAYRLIPFQHPQKPISSPKQKFDQKIVEIFVSVCWTDSAR